MWRLRRLWLQIAVRCGWRASFYSGALYWPAIYGVNIAWWDAYEFNRGLRARREAMMATLAELETARKALSA